MTYWILILWVMPVQGGAAIDKIEFPTEQSCLAAKALLEDRAAMHGQCVVIQ